MTDRVWLFDLDNTLHDAGAWVFAQMNDTMRSYVVDTLGVTPAEADALREKYWRRYGSTMLGLVRHHDVSPAHFLHETHRFPGLEQRVTGHRHDLAAIARLRGRRIVLTNAPRAYAMRVLGALGIVHLFEQVLSIEDMRMFGDWRPKPDRRMLRRMAVRLGVHPSRCVLVEDSLDNVLAARRVGMQPVWMQRFARRGAHAGPRVGRWSVHPSGVRIVRTLRSLVQGRPSSA
ncbi:MAG TPA: pyrimidine 5'-nucleotidase [Burkholderiaceae bacterium]